MFCRRRFIGNGRFYQFVRKDNSLLLYFVSDVLVVQLFDNRLHSTGVGFELLIPFGNADFNRNTVVISDKRIAGQLLYNAHPYHLLPFTVSETCEQVAVKTNADTEIVTVLVDDLSNGIIHLTVLEGILPAIPVRFLKNLFCLFQLSGLVAAGRGLLQKIFDFVVNPLEYIPVIDGQIPHKLRVREKIVANQLRCQLRVDVRVLHIPVQLLNVRPTAFVIFLGLGVLGKGGLQLSVQLRTLQNVGDLMANHIIQRFVRIDIQGDSVLGHIAVNGFSFNPKAGFLQLLVVCKIKRNAQIGGRFRDKIHEIMGLVGIVQNSAVYGVLDNCPLLFAVPVQIRREALLHSGALIVALRKPFIFDKAVHLLRQLFLCRLQRALVGICVVFLLQLLQPVLLLFGQLVAFRLIQLFEFLIFRLKILVRAVFFPAQNLFDGIRGYVALFHHRCCHVTNLFFFFIGKLLSAFFTLRNQLFGVFIHNILFILCIARNEILSLFYRFNQASLFRSRHNTGLHKAAGYYAADKLLQQVFVLQNIQNILFGHIGHLFSNRGNRAGNNLFNALCAGLDRKFGNILCYLSFEQAGYLFCQHIVRA